MKVLRTLYKGRKFSEEKQLQKGVLRIFVTFTGNHQRRSSSLVKGKV